jgi:CubicO group peptidase (beta-lactamase class C family)
MTYSARLFRLWLLWLVSIFCLISACRPVSDKTENAVKTNEKNELITQYLNAHAFNRKFNGNALIAKGDSIIYSKSFGLADIDRHVPNSDSTIFLIGSITKPFTALSILILVDQGKLSLDDPLAKFFPEIKVASKITITHLLNHTSGLQDYRSFPNWEKEGLSDATTPMTNVVKLYNAPLLFEPGEQFRYCNNGYILLGLIIEQVSRNSFASFVQEEILHPLALENTGVIKNDTIVEDLAVGYSSSPVEIEKAKYINYAQPFTSGNMYSTTEDLWKFTKGVMGSALLTEELTAKIFSSGQYYGFGWGIRNFDGIKAYGHYGGMNGFISSVTYFPSDSTFICLLTNDDCTPKARITSDLVTIMQGKEVTLPIKKTVIGVSEKEMQSIVGDYLIKPYDTLHVFEDSGRLYQQENNQYIHELFPYQPLYYQFKLLEFDAVFAKESKHKMQSLFFVGKDTILEAKRIGGVM